MALKPFGSLERQLLINLELHSLCVVFMPDYLARRYRKSLQHLVLLFDCKSISPGFDLEYIFLRWLWMSSQKGHKRKHINV